MRDTIGLDKTYDLLLRWPPGCFTEWCNAVISQLAQCALGSIELLGINTLDELALAMITTEASQFVVCSRQPRGGAQTALTQAGKRFIAVLDEPRIELRVLAIRPGFDLVGATRAVASSGAATLGCGFVRLTG